MIKTLKKSELKNLLTEKNLLEFNRDIQLRHVEKMSKSVMDCGILRLPVIGDVSSFDKRGFVIVDGQHLCKAIVNLPTGFKLPTGEISNISVIVKKYDSKKQLIDDISKLNNTQKSWGDEDYLEAWFKYGKDNYSYYSNYNYLNFLYEQKYDGFPCGFLVELYATSKNSFREGTLEFKNKELSDNLAEICYDLYTNHDKASFALHGLRIWAFNRITEKKNIDWAKLKSRLYRAVNRNEDKNTQGREDFKEFIQEIYTRL